MASITLDELYSYHSIDRSIFSWLVGTLRREPAESMLVMATWLRLEEKGYLNLVTKVAQQNVSMVNALANEVVFSLRCLELDKPPVAPDGGMSITSKIIGKDINLHLFYQYRFTAIAGIKRLLNSVCSRIFTDILQHALHVQVSENHRLRVPGFPHVLFGHVYVVHRARNYRFPTGVLWGWDMEVCEDDRTMFLTFSRGFPVTEEEVKELFTHLYGNCVEAVHMQKNHPAHEQPVYARMVLRSVITVDDILKGNRIAKFRINGKHIWARKFVRRTERLCFPNI